MRQVWPHGVRRGGELSVRGVPVPEPGPCDFRVHVHGSSVNKGDRLVITGTPYGMRLALGMRAPKHLGLGQDVAGVVSAVGDGVTSWQAGEAVFGELTLAAAWADEVVA